MKKEGTSSVCVECKSSYYLPPSARAKSSYCSRKCRAVGQSKWQARDLSLRFWEKVQKTETCWLWNGAMLKTGYGSIRVDGKAQRAHRVAYELRVGKIPPGMLLRHSCDTPRCVNPAHLSVGTKRDNTKDALERGLHVCGENHCRAKISNSGVVAIKEALAAGVSGRFLAKQFNVNESMISQIKTGTKRRYG